MADDAAFVDLAATMLPLRLLMPPLIFRQGDYYHLRITQSFAFSLRLYYSISLASVAVVISEVFFEERLLYE